MPPKPKPKLTIHQKYHLQIIWNEANDEVKANLKTAAQDIIDSGEWPAWAINPCDIHDYFERHLGIED